MNTSHNYSSFFREMSSEDVELYIDAPGLCVEHLVDEARLRELTYTPSPLFFSRTGKVSD